MSYNLIVFPGLGISVDPSPVAFTLFSKPIYWYGIIIAAGFCLAVCYALRKCTAEGIKEDDLLDVVIITTPIAIIGARAYYVIFNLSSYSSFADMLKIWEGGLAIYGGVIAAAAAAFICCRVKKLSFLKVLDLTMLGFMIGQCIGRWGNFFNREAYGGLYDGLLRMEIALRGDMTDAAGNIVAFAGERAAVHPTFLYESVWNLVGFVLISSYRKRHKKFDGETTLMYFLWYGVGRAFIEGLRADSLYLMSTGIRTSQLVAVITAVLSLAALIYMYVKKPYLNGGCAADGTAGETAAADAASAAGSADGPAPEAETDEERKAEEKK